MKAYEAGFNSTLDGREKERALQRFFRTAEGKQKDELLQKLAEFLGRYNKQPNALTQIHIR